MSIVEQKIPGASSGYGNTRPVLKCDGPKCSNQVVGNAGMSHDGIQARAHSLGYRRSMKTSKDFCPTCGPKVGAKA